MTGRPSLAAGVTGGLVFVLLALGWVLLRLGQVHLSEQARFGEQARRMHALPERPLPAERGALLDRRGRVLAHTETLPFVAIDPSVISSRDRVAALLREELGVPREEFDRRVAEGGERFVYLRRRIADRAATRRVAARARAEGMRGVIVRDEPVRVYPGGAVAAHVLGFTDRSGRGVEGAERLLETRLRGRRGVSRTQRDGLGRRIATPGQGVPPQRGESVRLTLDLVVQTFAERILDQAVAAHHPKAAVAAVVDVPTGDLLAVTVRPGFDPNTPGAFPAEVRRNRFLTDVTEPGSTFKPIVMGLALDAGVVRPRDVFDCSGGVIQVGPRRIREDAHHDYEHLTAAGVIARSSNVGMVQVGQRLGRERMYFGLRLFGFGSRALPGWVGESSGKVQRLGDWREHWTLESVSFGHEVSVTPAQILSAYATIAGGGVRRPLRLVADAPPRATNRVIGAEAIADLVGMLEEVMRSGTGRHVSRKVPSEYRIAGKTGTAQKIVGGAIDGHVGSFACFGPAENPRLAVLILCDEPEGRGYGSIVAAPYAVDLLRSSLRYLGVPASAAADADAVGWSGKPSELEGR